MILANEQAIVDLLSSDKETMSALRIVQSLDLPDWWICAGFVRSKIWDKQHGFSHTTLVDDVDVVYFDQHNTDESIEKELEQRLRSTLPTIPWSVKNEARMHHVNGLEPYIDTIDAISKFPETVTAIGIKLDTNDSLRLVAPHGVDDILNMAVRPTPYFTDSNQRMQIYHHRIQKKKWHNRWPKVTYLVE
ncbi:nucleotidyltransferase family protein [Paucisalibacillus globulus]|uniref:nucleotidyltransferase family protein n=1 Tax=Paucisalibacillus globulus TaxID=351095 RepID=UPI0020D15385|nr:nucleotidyltransferase family protein [Paucisalibacillus globulus]